MADFPALPLWTDAYLGDTMHLSLEQHGAYLKLLMIAWRTADCSLPDNDEKLARMLGVTAKKWASLRSELAPFWQISDGTWRQKKLTEVRRAVAVSSDKQSSRASARWKAKALNNNKTQDAAAMPGESRGNANQNHNQNHMVEGKEHSSKTYYFTGSVVRLTREDFDRWAAAFPAIFDLKAELTSIDAWLASQPDGDRKWFHRTAGMLNKRQQALAKEAATPDTGGEHVARVGF